MKQTIVVLPVKDIEACKSRLAVSLSPIERQQLVRNLLKRLLQTLTTQMRHADIVVISPSSSILQMATELGAHTIRERNPSGLNLAMQRATKWSVAQGYKVQCFLAPDIASFDIAELQSVVTLCQKTSSIVVGRSSTGGTNVLCCNPPNAIDFRFGENSAAEHCIAAREANYKCHLLLLPTMQYDVNLPSDLKRLCTDLRSTITYNSSAQAPP